MAKLSYEDIELMLAEARLVVPPASNWRHYKGEEYTIGDIVIQESDNSLAVVYSSLQRSGVAFVRPLADWQADVEWDGQAVKRFTQI